MNRRASLVATFVLALLTGLGAASARAQAPDEAAWIDAGSSARDDAEAKRLYADGKVKYAQGHYVQALVLFERAYALSQAPALLFNMAQAHRLSGGDHCPQAVALYKSYLAAAPNAENRREVEERVLELGACESQAAPAAPAPVLASKLSDPIPKPASARESQAAAGPPQGALLVTSVGAALLVAGGALYAAAYAKHREAERVCPCYPGTYAKWEALTNVSYASLAVGGATLLGGVSWWIVGAPASRSAPAQATLGLSGRF